MVALNRGSGQPIRPQLLSNLCRKAEPLLGLWFRLLSLPCPTLERFFRPLVSHQLDPKFSGTPNTSSELTACQARTSPPRSLWLPFNPKVPSLKRKEPELFLKVKMGLVPFFPTTSRLGTATDHPKSAGACREFGSAARATSASSPGLGPARGGAGQCAAALPRGLEGSPDPSPPLGCGGQK